jgi:HPt (histidine-containing phosphotransfer) domain-containing protein
LPPPTPEAQYVLSCLNELADSDDARFQRLAQSFLRSIQDALHQIETACATQNAAVLRAMGHRAKSTALSAGATTLGQSFLQLERHADSGDIHAAIAMAQQLPGLFKDIQQAIEHRLAG